MKLLKNLLGLAIALGMAGVGVMFAIQNENPVPLDILVLTLEPRSVALWVLAALALGGILGMMLSSFAVLRLRTRLIAARRQIASAQTELDRIRSAGHVNRE
ncbi:MAG: lipopolysaccharide assembly protein LapA domain-containing protein [Pseudomonadota bacterium]